MPTAESISEMLMRGVTSSTKSDEAWKSYLRTVSNLYKYSYYDQLMIYAQRPDASACAEYSLWNKIGRYVRRGSKGIAVTDGSDSTKLRYVFDISDTGARNGAKDVNLWKYSYDSEDYVSRRLSETYNVDNSGDFNRNISVISSALTDEYWENNKYDIMSVLAENGNEDVDSDELRDRFGYIVSSCAAYSVYARCGMNTVLPDLSGYISPFNAEIYGGAIHDVSSHILYQIERGIKAYEKEKEYGLHEKRRQYYAGHTDRAVRSDEAEISGREPSGSAESPDTDREAELTSGGNGRDGKEIYIADNSETGSGKRSDGIAKGNRSDEMDWADEQLPSAGGGDDYERDNLQLNFQGEYEPDDIKPVEYEADNFHITDEHLGEGGQKTKFTRNIEAIRLLKQLEAESRQASPDEQDILSKYVGWGGLPEAFDIGNSAWKNEYAGLMELLTPDEYDAAKASTLNAHYTSPTVIKAIYEAVSNMGFSGGNILEPSMGVGNFFGLIPDSMSSSHLYGVELDSITGRIAKQLYPKADITVAGFETTDRRDFFDLAVGNVPFGNYRVNDRQYNKLGFSIHDYFIAKSLDQLRPGGILAFVTSRYTLDKKSPEVRKYLSQRAEFLGAVRLPNNAFKANAGTEVVSDIIFLQKRDRPAEIDADWIHTAENKDGYHVNSYFALHPEMVFGRESSANTQYAGQDFTVEPIEGADLSVQLAEALKHIHGRYEEAEISVGEKVSSTIPADPRVKNYSYAVVDGEVYYRENSVMVKPDISASAAERIKGMAEIRDTVHELIDLQMYRSGDDKAIRSCQKELNDRYDSFTSKYGLINSRANSQAFSDDSSYYLLCSLEILNEDGQLKRKADMFTKRTIKPHEAVKSVDTAAEALALSISEKASVDIPYMSELTGKDEAQIVSELRGVIFRIPDTDIYKTADEYLSGNVRQKLAEAESAFERDNTLAENVSALKTVQPKDLDASEIDVRLGAAWIGKEYINQFMHETFETPGYLRNAIKADYTPVTSEWQISNKTYISNSNVNAYIRYGTERANSYKILEDTLNLRDTRVYDTVQGADGKDRRVLNSKETTLAQQKQQLIKDAFKDWIWKSPERRNDVVKQYNTLFNSNRPREYDGSHVSFAGMNPEIQLRTHQKNAAAHIIYGGNTLLAHVVGAGKSFEMAAAAMESKRLGLCTKSLFVVPNHLIEQWAGEFLRLYPAANILVSTKKDFETANRKKFCSRIATGDYDAVIIGHSQFEKIPISYERQERLIKEQITEVEEGITELNKTHAERLTVKSLEKTKRGLEAKLKKLTDTGRKDDVVTFEQLGVDRLFVDEAHSYKNCFTYTKMRNVAGISSTDAQKSSDMLMKCRYMDEITGGRGIIFATGTPVSNSMVELYTMMRYLQHDTLKQKGLTHFDCWASVFGETQTAIELAPEGTGYRARTRFSKFFNLPELMNIFKEAADIKTADQLKLPVPEAVYHNIVAQPTDIQKDMVQQLSQRASRVHSGTVAASEDNMLCITNDGRKLGLDQRVVNPNLPDEPASKVNLCVDNIYSIWKDGEKDRLTQLVFSDLSTPKEGENFNIYDDIRNKLIGRGIPKEEIVFIHEADTEAKKKELFAKVRSGDVRVLIGSTFKMGSGMNVQDRLIALHSLDCPWRPGDLAQREGRIIRQGNMNPEVHIYRYVTESTFDAYLWQTVEQKQKFISQIMTSKSPVRSCDDVDETALSYAEVKALCAGDERIRKKMDLDVEVSKLQLMKADHQSQQFRLEDNLLKSYPEQVRNLQYKIDAYEKDRITAETHPHPEDGFIGMNIQGDEYTDRESAGKALIGTYRQVIGKEPVEIGNYRGFVMSMSLEKFGGEYILNLKGAAHHQVSLGNDARGNITRIDNAITDIPKQIEAARSSLKNVYMQIENAKAEIGKPFPREEELKVKSERLAKLNSELDMDMPSTAEVLFSDEEAADMSEKKPSILEEMKSIKEHADSRISTNTDIRDNMCLQSVRSFQ